jgi:hypothetical protein
LLTVVDDVLMSQILTVVEVNRVNWYTKTRTEAKDEWNRVSDAGGDVESMWRNA